MSERVILIGTSALARALAAEFMLRGSRYSLLGLISESRDADTEGCGCRHLGTLEGLQRIISDYAPARVVVAPDESYAHLPADLLVEIQAGRQLIVEAGTEVYERLTGKLAIESLPAGTVVFSSEFRPSRVALMFARASSTLAAALALVLFLPLMALIAALIHLESPGPVLFVQERVGLGGRRFKLFKFRSMREAAGVHSEWEADNNDRITRLGRWLRKYRLDELPQFINVLRGDMNLVGPRPHPVSNRELFILVSRNTPRCGEQIPYYSLRSSIHPGITGWAQVRYKYANGLDEEMEKLRYDLYYIKHYSLLMDLRILLETVKVVILGHRRQVLPPPLAAANVAEDSPREVPQVLPGLAQALRKPRKKKTGRERRQTGRRRGDLHPGSLSRVP